MLFEFSSSEFNANIWRDISFDWHRGPHLLAEFQNLEARRWLESCTTNETLHCQVCLINALCDPEKSNARMLLVMDDLAVANKWCRTDSRLFSLKMKRTFDHSILR
ncbi:hypothetical protein A6X21_09880 [Planctopirus hydrillae]|uniref:Uncharacterized protein n=1 Tax=Planctopirus hydrillae TaxID=1841610 RepID=A0A1C3E7A8_9PLAN|nr:hypothetical protein A6X21_09880 [Planctopirus hydrillae]